MKINKLFYFILFLSTLSCKDINTENAKNKVQAQQKNVSLKPKIEINDSFVISCGSGCAMRYTKKSEATTGVFSKEITFNVEMFINEVLTEEYSETYLFNCKKNENKIFLKEDDSSEIIDLHPSILENLTKYLKEMCHENNKDYYCEGNGAKANIYEEPLYNTCTCEYDFSKCYSIFYKEQDNYYKKMLLDNLPRKDTIVFFDTNLPNTEYKVYKKDSIIIVINQEGGSNEYIFKKKNNNTIIQYYAYPP